MKTPSKTTPSNRQQAPAAVSASRHEEKTGTNTSWTAVHRVRLPHRSGLPLGSGGCGDSAIR